MTRLHIEKHAGHRAGWLRAAVLGANDGLVSTASLVVGVAASAASGAEVLLAGTAGLVAGAMSMAAGEYVSVSSQSDTEAADLAKERRELAEMPDRELHELAGFFRARGVTAEVARTVAEQMTAHDALGAHAREELGLSEITTARPLQAAMTSAATFAVGAGLPLAVVLIAPPQTLIYTVSTATLVFLAGLGALGARAGGADIKTATLRVTFWGAAAMAVTAAVGGLFGAVV